MMGSPRVEQITAALNSNFGAAGWLAFALHAIGVEIYVSSCPPFLASLSLFHSHANTRPHLFSSA